MRGLLALLVLWASPASALVLVGDSITLAGYLDPGESYADQLEAAGWPVTNLAVGGATAQDWRPGGIHNDTLDVVVFGDQVIIMLGTNDVLPWQFPLELAGIAYAEGMAALIADLRDRGAFVRVIGPTDWPTGGPVIFEQKIALFRELLPSVCEAGMAVCGPTLEGLFGPEDYALGLGVHPSASGHTKIAYALLEALPEPSAGAVGLLVVVWLRRVML